MSRLARFLSCTGRTGDCCHVNLINDESCGSQRKSRKLDGSRKATWICHVVCFLDLLACALTETIHEIASGIISIKSEIISEVDYPALGLDVVCIHELA